MGVLHRSSYGSATLLSLRYPFCLFIVVFTRFGIWVPGLQGILEVSIILSRHLPGLGVSEDLWIAQAFAIFVTIGSWWWRNCVNSHEGSCNPRNTRQQHGKLQSLRSFWEREVMSIHPFIMNIIRPHEDVIITSIILTPHSIKFGSTQKLPSPSTLPKVELLWIVIGLWCLLITFCDLATRPFSRFSQPHVIHLKWSS